MTVPPGTVAMQGVRGRRPRWSTRREVGAGSAVPRPCLRPRKGAPPMPLSTIAAAPASVPISKLGQTIPLAKEVQTRLAVLGCLDPPADGQFGSASKLTLARYAKQRG